MRLVRDSESNVRPLALMTIAESVSRSYGDKGAIVITSGDDGIRLGIYGLDLNDAKDALCVAIYHTVFKSLSND